MPEWNSCFGPACCDGDQLPFECLGFKEQSYSDTFDSLPFDAGWGNVLPVWDIINGEASVTTINSEPGGLIRSCRWHIQNPSSEFSSVEAKADISWFNISHPFEYWISGGLFLKPFPSFMGVTIFGQRSLDHTERKYILIVEDNGIIETDISTGAGDFNRIKISRLVYDVISEISAMIQTRIEVQVNQSIFTFDTDLKLRPRDSYCTMSAGVEFTREEIRNVPREERQTVDNYSFGLV